MPGVNEFGTGSAAQLKPALDSGITTISGDQTITFTLYRRRIIPADGFVFWVNSALLPSPIAPVTISGSLHQASEKVQGEREVMSRVSIIFTSKEDASQAFNAIGPTDLMIGTVSGDGASTSIRFAFSRLGFFANAGIYHYSGTAILPTMATQIVDDSGALDLVNPVASNSLPAWLTLNNYTPFYGFGNAIPLFPSFLTQHNFEPPYGTVHVETDRSLAFTPTIGPTSSHSALSADRVRVSLTGVRNDDAQTFLDCVTQYSRDYNALGLMNAPVVRDEKESQAELGVLAQRKLIDFEVSYIQASMRDIARQAIKRAVLTNVVLFKVPSP